MPSGLKNWTCRDVKAFLKERGFYFYEQRKGSHEAWISQDNKYMVEINIITGSESYPPRTLETMIRQSGISKNEWRNWGSR